MIIKNLENKIKLAGILSIGCFATSIVISGMVLAFCFSLVKAERKKIYVLDNDVPVLVKQTGTEVNLEVECKSHINLFHTLFFTLPPDDEFIKYNMEKAMYLIDDSGLKQYNNGIIHFRLVCLYIIKIRKDVGSREKCPTFCYKFAE